VATLGASPFNLSKEASTTRSCRYHRGVDMTPLNINNKKIRHMEQGDNARGIGLDPVLTRGR
jgi:hypothetical protein